MRFTDLTVGRPDFDLSRYSPSYRVSFTRSSRGATDDADCYPRRVRDTVYGGPPGFFGRRLGRPDPPYTPFTFGPLLSITGPGYSGREDRSKRLVGPPECTTDVRRDEGVPLKGRLCLGDPTPTTCGGTSIIAYVYD